jgi:hypothetical protein
MRKNIFVKGSKYNGPELTIREQQLGIRYIVAIHSNVKAYMLKPKDYGQRLLNKRGYSHKRTNK